MEPKSKTALSLGERARTEYSSFLPEKAADVRGRTVVLSK
jgi:hypothetical protein